MLGFVPHPNLRAATLRERMESADIERLSHWCERVLTADSLNDIFGEPH
jgi:hypothetical protein